VSNIHNYQFESYSLTTAILWRAETRSEKISTPYTKIVAMDGSRLLPFELHNLIVNYLIIYSTYCFLCRSQWSRRLRRRIEPASSRRLWVRIPPRKWISVCCECCVLLGRDFCDELIICTEESYRPLCVVVCDLETS